MIFARLVLLLLFSFGVSTTVFAQQRVAILTPEKQLTTTNFVENLDKHLRKTNKLIDRDLSDIAFRSFHYATPFNLTVKESKNIGTAIGCDYFLLIKVKNQRRATSYDSPEYYESYAIVYVVSARTGNLVYWKLQSFDAAREEDAEKLLFDSVEDLATNISEKIATFTTKATDEKVKFAPESIPEADSTDATGFRPPLPFNRIRPKYTGIAKLYNVEATVDIEIDVDESGNILRTEIVRWAGFGLDESVTETVREMNWRPADRNGKPLPVRALLRYNFKNIEDDKSKRLQ